MTSPALAPPLRVSLDVSAVPARPAGAGRYTIELAAALAERDDVDPVLVARRADADRWRSLAGPSGSVAAVAPAPRPLRLAWEQVGLPSTLDRLGAVVHHGPHYTMPERARQPVVVTVHDCTFFDHPEWHQRSKAALFRRAIRTAARRADALVCVSAATAARLADLCAPSVPVFVAPHGVDQRRFAPEEPRPGADREELARLGLDAGRPFVAFVGTVEPRKGVAPLVRAFDRLAADRPDLLLVVAGQPGWRPRGSRVDEAARAIADAHHADRVRRVGYVPDDAVPALLRAAAAVAYPALEEGFGLPALEALACGAPLVTTEGTAMAELAGGAALLATPGDPGSLAGALEAALDGSGTSAAERRRLGLQAARSSTWSASAGRHVAAYRAAAGLGPVTGAFR